MLSGAFRSVAKGRCHQQGGHAGRSQVVFEHAMLVMLRAAQGAAASAYMHCIPTLVLKDSTRVGAGPLGTD